MTLLWLNACASPDGWDTDLPQRGVTPTFEQLEFECGVDGHGSVDIPAGAPVFLEVFGGRSVDEAEVAWWYYTEVPAFRPGEPLVIPCEEGQEFGRVTYAHE